MEVMGDSSLVVPHVRARPAKGCYGLSEWRKCAVMQVLLKIEDDIDGDSWVAGVSEAGSRADVYGIAGERRLRVPAQSLSPFWNDSMISITSHHHPSLRLVYTLHHS